MLHQKIHADPSPSPDDFRAAMRHFPGNVSVITVGTGKERSGLVVTSAVSLAAEPPMVIACINRSSSSWPLLGQFGHFGVNSLSSTQKEIAERFSGRGGIKGADRYANAEWITLETGAPLLRNASVALVCALEDMIDRASHSIIIGRVKAIRVNEGQGALVYWQGAYHPMSA